MTIGRIDFTDNQKKNKKKRERYIKRLQRRLARQKKGSNRRQKTKNRLARKAKQKAGLNKAILNTGWHYLEAYTRYKAAKTGKAVFKVPAPSTSQECAECGHTHPDNLQSNY